MVGPRDSRPNELDHEISFACSIASVMRAGSLRTKRKGGLRAHFSHFQSVGRLMGREPQGSLGGRRGLARLREQGSLRVSTTARRMSHASHHQHGCLRGAGLSDDNSQFDLLSKQLRTSSYDLPAGGCCWRVATGPHRAVLLQLAVMRDQLFF